VLQAAEEIDRAAQEGRSDHDAVAEAMNSHRAVTTSMHEHRMSTSDHYREQHNTQWRVQDAKGGETPPQAQDESQAEEWDRAAQV